MNRAWVRFYHQKTFLIISGAKGNRYSRRLINAIEFRLVLETKLGDDSLKLFVIARLYTDMV